MQSWLSGTQSPVNVDVQIAEHIVQQAEVKLREAVNRNFEEPLAHLNYFG